jgi:flotillin
MIAVLAPQASPLVMAALIAVSMLLVMVVFGTVYATHYRKVGPNQVLVVSGMRMQVRDSKGMLRTVGFRLVRGGGTLVWPVLERCDVLSLEVVDVHVETRPIVSTDGGPVVLVASAQVKVGSDEMSIARAVEQILSRTPAQIGELARGSLMGHFGAVVARMSRDDAHRERGGLGEKVRVLAEEDLSKFGLQIVSLTLLEVRNA